MLKRCIQLSKQTDLFMVYVESKPNIKYIFLADSFIKVLELRVELRQNRTKRTKRTEIEIQS